MAVARPVPSTVATEVSELPQVNVGCGANGNPSSSRAAATNRSVEPSADSTAISGDSATDAATCSTVTAAVEVAEPEVAVTVAVPPATAVTRPVDVTLATVDAEDAQATEAPFIRAPF